MTTPYAISACTELAQGIFSQHGNLIRTREELTKTYLTTPRIYFVHWHWKVPKEILGTTYCIGFHMTDLPWGRGSYAYEKLIHQNFRETVLTCFEMQEEYDTGDILMKRIIPIEIGKDFTMRLVYWTCWKMIQHIEEYGPPMRVPQLKGAAY